MSEIIQERAGLVKFPFEVAGIHSNFFRRFKISAATGGIRPNSFGTGQDYLKFLCDQVGLVKISPGAGKIYTLGSNRWDKLKIIRQWTGLAKIPSRLGRINQNSFCSRWD